MSLPIEHESAAQRFVVRLPQGRGELLYGLVGSGVLDLYHAEVSPGARGRGVAAALVQAACEYARGAGLKLIPTCPYVEWWFGQHPECSDLLAGTSGHPAEP